MVFSFLSFGVVFLFGSLYNVKIIESSHQALLYKSVIQLKKITEASRNDLLQGNIRIARNSISLFEDANVFSAFQIVQNDKILDQSWTDTNYNLNDFIKIPINVEYSEQGAQWGKIIYFVSSKELQSLSNHLKSQLLLASIVTAIITLVVSLALFLLFWLSSSPLAHIFKLSFNDDPSIAKQRYITNLVWNPLIKEISHFSSKYKNFQNSDKEHKIKEKMYEVARQVAHDIRSPLSALKIALGRLEDNFEERELIFNASIRIEKIASDLLDNSRVQTQNENLNKCVPKETVDIVELVTIILAEKKLYYTGNIVCDIGQNEEINVRADRNEVLRILSNIMNNSLEAIVGVEKPEVAIYLRAYNEVVELSIVDNGVGIAEEKIHLLGNKGMTFGKSDGNGLGLFHAKEYLKNIGGKIDFQSKLGVGTAVKISFSIL